MKIIDQVFFLPKRTCVHLDLKETKNITHFLLLNVPIVISVVLYYEQLCRAPTSVSDGIFL